MKISLDEKREKEGRVQYSGKCQAFLVMTKTVKERQEKVSRSQEEKVIGDPLQRRVRRLEE